MRGERTKAVYAKDEAGECVTRPTADYPAADAVEIISKRLDSLVRSLAQTGGVIYGPSDDCDGGRPARSGIKGRLLDCLDLAAEAEALAERIQYGLTGDMRNAKCSD